MAKKQLTAEDFCPVCGDILKPGQKFCSEDCANLFHKDFAFYFSEEPDDSQRFNEQNKKTKPEKKIK